MDIVRQSAKKKTSALMFSLEQSGDELMDKMICQESGLNLWAMQSGNMSKKKEAKYFETVGQLGDLNVMIDDNGGISPAHMKSTVEKLKGQNEIDLIVVDYLQLMTAGFKTNSKVEEVTYISAALKSIAKEYQIPVLALAQLNRSVELRGDTTPRLSDLRDSGSIEQDADVVMFLSRDKGEQKDSLLESELVIAKHRAGPVGIINLLFDKASTSFRSKKKNNVV